MVCFSLYSASRAATRLYAELLEPWGLTYTQYLVLVVLSAEGPQPVKQLGERLQLDSGTLSPLLKRLEAKGYVEKERSAADSRKVVIALSDAGRKLQQDLEQVGGQFACGTGLESVQQAQSLIAQLNQLTASMQHYQDTTHTTANERQ